MADRVRDAVLRKDAQWLSGWFSGRWGMDVAIDWVQSKLDQCFSWLGNVANERNTSHELNYSPSDFLGSGGTIDLWFRARATEDNLYKAGSNPISDVHVPVEMHVFFIGIEETEEMLARLRNETQSKPPKHLGTAVSKIETTQQKISPIDRVALRVAPTDGPTEQKPEST